MLPHELDSVVIADRSRRVTAGGRHDAGSTGTVTGATAHRCGSRVRGVLLRGVNRQGQWGRLAGGRLGGVLNRIGARRNGDARRRSRRPGGSVLDTGEPGVSMSAVVPCSAVVTQADRRRRATGGAKRRLESVATIQQSMLSSITVSVSRNTFQCQSTFFGYTYYLIEEGQGESTPLPSL